MLGSQLAPWALSPPRQDPQFPIWVTAVPAQTHCADSVVDDAVKQPCNDEAHLVRHPRRRNQLRRLTPIVVTQSVHSLLHCPPSATA